MNKQQDGGAAVVDQRLVKALGHPLRVQALSILNERVASPNELAKELGEGLSQVSYHVKVLSDCECIELVKTEPRRGAVEHYYRATARAFITDQHWAQLPDSLKPSVSAETMRSLVGDVAGALESGTFDARPDRHLSWTPLVVDEKGWKEIAQGLAGLLDRVLEIEAESAKRLASSKEQGINATVGLLGFEAPAERKRAGRGGS
jgi:DNA-binding transcriptional ArsR family regulator